MSRRLEMSIEQRVEVVQSLLSRDEPAVQLARRLGIRTKPIRVAMAQNSPRCLPTDSNPDEQLSAIGICGADQSEDSRAVRIGEFWPHFDDIFKLCK
ncbi:MAG: hypothetical protein JJU36_17985 [Phycisphaeraceae bacterium]|nr:hypothetical protein [Phycisphaeraceae bacterium]